MIKLRFDEYLMRYTAPKLNTFLLSKFFSLFLIIVPSSLLSEVFENLQNRRHYIGTYFQVASYFYEEPKIMNKESQLPFLGIGQRGFITSIENPFLYEFDIQYGKTDYVGSAITTSDPTYVLNANLNKSWQINEINLSLGLGYRHLKDDWGGKQTALGNYTYDRVSEYFYLSTGLTLFTSSRPNFSINYRHLIRGKQTSYLQSIPGYSNATNSQKTGYGLKAEYYLKNNLSIFIDYWNIEKSDNDQQGQGIYEPSNYTTQIGFRYKLRLK